MNKEVIIKLIDSSIFGDVILGLELAYEHMEWEEFDLLLNKVDNIFKERIINTTSDVEATIIIWDPHYLMLDHGCLWRLLDDKKITQTRPTVILGNKV